jgi:hypothetical protein
MKRFYLAIAATSSLCLLSTKFAKADSVFDYINTPEFTKNASVYYLQRVQTNGQRLKLISTAQEECGGRYEGTETKVTELSHEIVLDKNYVRTQDPKSYKLIFDATAESRFLVVETIHCSVHEGHNLSVLHAEIIAGTESRKVIYVIKNDIQQGKATLSRPVHSYKEGALQLSSEYKTPYGTVINP